MIASKKKGATKKKGMIDKGKIKEMLRVLLPFKVLEKLIASYGAEGEMS